MSADRAELMQQLRTRQRPERLDPDLVRTAELVLHVRQVGQLDLGLGRSQDHRLDADDVREVVLHRPAGAVGRQLPLRLVEPVAEALHRSPHVGQRVDERADWSSLRQSLHAAGNPFRVHVPREVTDQVGVDDALGEAPFSRMALEPVAVLTGDDRLQREIGKRLDHGEVACAPTRCGCRRRS